MFDEKAFRELLKRKGVKMVALAGAMGISKSSLYRKITGDCEFTRSEIQACCEFLSMPDMNDIFFAKTVA